MIRDPVTSAEPEYLDPEDHPPPRGRKIQLLTIGGIAVEGDWTEHGGFVAWAPLLKIPPKIKAKLARINEYFAELREKDEARWKCNESSSARPADPTKDTKSSKPDLVISAEESALRATTDGPRWKSPSS